METVEPQLLYNGVRATAVKILNRIERSDAYLDKVLDAELKTGDISGADKNLLVELVHGVMRWQGRLDWILNRYTHGNFPKSDINVKNTLRIALYQIMFLDRLPHYAAVNEAVEFVKRIRGEKIAGLVNAVLRNIIRSLSDIQYPDKTEDAAQYLSVFYSHPPWLVKRWLQRFPKDELERFLAANNEIPPLTLRINKLKTNPSEFLALLDRQQVTYQGSSFIDYFIKVRSLAGITQLDIFQQGFFSIQDESAALPVLLLDPKPGERIIDLCAAPGGKTTLIGELINNQGSVIAVDKYEHKLNLIQQSCERLGITSVETVTADSSTLEMAPVDKVLVDAPCSGLGVLRKKPDLRWKREPEDIAHLALLQKNLMENATRLVKPGGILVYSTCTTEPEENEFLVREFLGRHPEFQPDNASQFVNKSVVTDDGFVQTLPHRDHIDGSFAARLRKSLET
ncbi:MAG: 16S rRNA (cytosine(967)-C(5))-methyltransferase RsmB [Bacteroidota bacterium]|jgi:16S rRNA (cytosine967-C5)-methyltransferase